MTQYVIDADAESVLRGYLQTQLLALGISVPVSTQVPNPRPDEFVRLSRTGGPRRTVISDEPQITVDCYADTETRAYEIAASVRAAMNAAPIIRGDTARVVELSGPQNFPDPSAPSSARYTQSFLVHMYSTALEVS